MTKPNVLHHCLPIRRHVNKRTGCLVHGMEFLKHEQLKAHTDHSPQAELHRQGCYMIQ